MPSRISVPSRISKDEALARIATEPRPSPCVMCSLLGRVDGDADDVTRPRLLERGRAASTMLNGYPLRWGHAMVVTHEHVTSYAELPEETAAEVMRLVRAVATRIERTLSPVRVFVASLGASRDDLAMTSPHLHWHVVPVSESPARPAEVLTWEHGVLEGTPLEWDALEALLRAP